MQNDKFHFCLKLLVNDLNTVKGMKFYMIYFTLSSVTACFFPDLVHIGIIPSFTATTPTLMESVGQKERQMQLHA